MEYPAYTDGVFNFSDSQYDLKPGEYIEFTVITVPDEEQLVNGFTPYGLYTNTVSLTPSQAFEKGNVCAGSVNETGTAIATSDTVSLYAINTTSEKSVALKSDSTVTASSSDGALENRIKAAAGDTLVYTLTVKNLEDNNYLEDFSIIDRLPYEGDVGVIATNDRGSVFRAKYAGNMRAIITLKDGTEIDVTEYITTSFASGTTGEESAFKSTDIDWLDTSVARAATRVVWGSEQTDSTNLVRFCLSQLSSYSGDTNPFAKQYTENGETYTKYGVPPEATIKITFEATIPEYIEDAGEGNCAWNSFGYYFNSGNEENMVAEPAKVGVWVEDDSYGGAILIRKNYTTNIPNDWRIFYFALFKGEYNADTNPKPIDTVSLMMKGTEEGAYAETYFTNIDYNNEHTEFYIYETDANYIPLVAESVETDTREYVDATGTSQGTKNYISSKTVTRPDGVIFTMDHEPQANTAFDKGTLTEFEGEYQKYDNNYLVWHKDLSPEMPTNSAIFSNSYIATTKYTVMGPFYADVPTDQSVATEGMTSTRPDSFEEGEINTVQDSTKRDEGSYASGTTYGATNKYGGKYKHTIATGFLALVEAVGTYTIEQADWTITTSNPQTSVVGVYVRLKTQSTASGESVLSLTDLEVYEENPEETLTLGAIDDFDDIEQDEDFLSDYTVEERAALIAEGLGIDPAAIQYNEYGEPYVVMDEELQEEAFAFSEATESTGTTYENFTGELTESGFKDAYDTNGYAIYKLAGTQQFEMSFADNIPHITLEAGSKAYVGIVIDQLYDRDAVAELAISDVATADDTMINAVTAASDQDYTNVKSPFQKNRFTVGALMKMTYNKPLYFNSFTTETTKYTSDIINADNSMKVTATSGKNITVNMRSYNYYAWSGASIEEYTYDSYLSLNGSGRKDYRSIVLNVPAEAILRVIAKSSGSDDRTLIVEDSTGATQSIVVPGSDNNNVSGVLAEQHVTIANGGAVYLYSAGSGIDVFSVEIIE